MIEQQRQDFDLVFSEIDKAIVAFERYITHGQTFFDRFTNAIVKGSAPADDYVLLDEKHACLTLFVGRANCSTCHTWPRFTDNHFHNTGVPSVAGLPADCSRVAIFDDVFADPDLVGISADVGLGNRAGGNGACAADGFARQLCATVHGVWWWSAHHYYPLQCRTRQELTSIASMLLAGIALGAMVMEMTGVLVYLADDRQLRDMTFWQLGSLVGATWLKISGGARRSSSLRWKRRLSWTWGSMLWRWARRGKAISAFRSSV